MIHDGPDILQDIGIFNAAASTVSSTIPKCTAWSGEDNAISATQRALRVFILESGFNIDHASRFAGLQSPRPNVILFEDSNPAFDLQKRVEQAFPEAKVLTIGASLRRSILRNVELKDGTPGEFYVPPTLIPAYAPENKEAAIPTLLNWIRGRGGDDHQRKIGILLAPAGTGKTALANELLRHFVRLNPRDGRSRRTSELSFPLLIDRQAWVDHEFRESSLNLAELLGSAILRQFNFQPSIESLQRCLRYGAITPILDGLDELCVTNPSVFNADDTIRGLIGALDGRQGNRVLLTCRESFWHDNIDADVQSMITAFRLSPFSEAQRQEYINKRFPAESDLPKRSRTNNLLRKISSIRRSSDSGSPLSHDLSSLPWVVHFTAESADNPSVGDTPFDDLGTIPHADPLGHVLFQFCRREQRRIGISLSPEGQIMFFSTLAAICDEKFAVEQIKTIHETLAGEPGYPDERSHIDFLRKHGFLKIGTRETANNCWFEYPEIQDYLRAKVAVDSICRTAACIGDDDVFRRCSKEQAHLLEFVSLLVRWRLSIDEIVSSLRDQRLRFHNIEKTEHKSALTGIMQILLRVLKDAELPPRDIIRRVCHYFNAQHDMIIDQAFVSGLLSRLDFRGVTIQDSIFEDAHLDHCIFSEQTRMIRVAFRGEFGVTFNCKNLGEVIFEECEYSTQSLQTFRQHKHRIGRAKIDRSHLDEACHHILQQFHIGQSGFRSKNFQDVKNEASKSSPIGDVILGRLIKYGALGERKGGNRHSLEVLDKPAVTAFIQQSICKGTVSQALNRLARDHLGDRL